MMSTQDMSPLDGQADRIMLSRTLSKLQAIPPTDAGYGTVEKAPPFPNVFVVWMLAHATRHAGRGGRPSAHRPKRPFVVPAVLRRASQHAAS